MDTSEVGLMPGASAIEWTDATWNPVTGCTRVSPGCAHCYIERQTPMRIAGRKFRLIDGVSTTGLELHPSRLEWPSSRAPERLAEQLGRPIRVFVNSMSDLFHEDIPRDFVGQVFEAMDSATDAIGAFQVLTKRPEHMRYLCLDRQASPDEVDDGYELGLVPGLYYDNPHPRVWLGVSIENHRWIPRADVLREIPAAVRFISAEPLLGSLVDIASCGSCWDWPRHDCPECEGMQWWYTQESLNLLDIHWLIAGGESGPRARPMNGEWARELRDLCTDVDIAFFFKQWGGKTPKSGGKILDGREWCDFPRPAVLA